MNELEKYYCSKHGGDGKENCRECKQKLKMLVRDNGGYLMGDWE